MPYKDYEKAKQRAKERYYENKEVRLAQVKDYYYKNWEVKQAQRTEWIKNNPEKIKQYKNKYNKKYIKDNPEKQTARNAVRWAIMKGKIIKPNNCSVCLQDTYSRNLHAHHHKGYSPENRLNILWLCGTCHRKEHYDKKNSNIITGS